MAADKRVGIVVGRDGHDYQVDGKPLDMESDKKADQGVIGAIKTYRPANGEYTYDPEHNTISPAGERAGTGDVGMYPTHELRRTTAPVNNCYDDIGRAAMEASELETHMPGAGVTSDKDFEAQEKEREKEEAEQAKADEKAAREREKAAR